jgi:hypothetical protein
VALMVTHQSLSNDTPPIWHSSQNNIDDYNDIAEVTITVELDNGQC